MNTRKETDISHICPMCHRGEGTPYRVAPHEPGTQRVLLCCEACGHRWSAIMPARPIAL